MRKSLSLLGLVVLMALMPAIPPGTTSIWSSAVGLDLANGIIPVGGAGQIPGHFQISRGRTKTGDVEIGIRAQERFIGPLPPQGKKYFADAGMTTLPDRALWNFDFHLDFGANLSEVVDGVPTLAVGPTNHTAGDFQVLMSVDCDPARNTKPVQFSLSGAGGIPANAKLFQKSWNMGFAFLNGVCLAQGITTGFPFNSTGEYEVALEVREIKAQSPNNSSNGKVVAKVQMFVVVW